MPYPHVQPVQYDQYDVHNIHHLAAEIIRVVKKELTVPKITQYYYEVKKKNKNEVLCRLLDIYDPKLSLVLSTSIPRAATSVATKISVLPLRNPFITRSLCDCFKT